MLLRVSASQRRKRKLGSAYRDEESGAPKKLKGHDIGLNSISGIRAGQDTTDSVEAQLFQSGVPQMDWSGMSTKASQMLDGYAPIFGDNTIPPVCPDPPQSNIASTGALFEYAPIFEDSTIPPVYSVTSFANMTAIGALSEYAPIFEDGTIPPVYSTSLRSTDAFCEYAPIFEDGTIPPLYSSRSHLDTAFSKVPCEDDVARFVSTVQNLHENPGVSNTTSSDTSTFKFGAGSLPQPDFPFEERHFRSMDYNGFDREIWVASSEGIRAGNWS
ncbi:unnamed protein product [Clonostachys chloroleuca]|uniref:Uncharacterized protein n=1 Tax=Clonostachys chloroleuca TaxID=1926264 RepID=A0AA35VPQ9_9HYPO|nr:unnamed protein product [Clonostachys chloroleuca]